MLFGLIATLFAAVPQEEAPPRHGEGWLTASYGVAAYFDNDLRMDIAYTGRADEPNLVLICDDNALRVRIGIDPDTDIPAAMRDFWGRDRVVYGTLSVDGEARVEARGVYFPTYRIVAPEGRKTAAAVFNAIARGDAVTYAFRGEEVSYTLPPVDEAFKAWLRGCKARGAI